VVVVRAEDDVFVALAGQVGENIADRGVLLFDCGIERSVE